MPNRQCGFEVKDKHGPQCFTLTHSQLKLKTIKQKQPNNDNNESIMHNDCNYTLITDAKTSKSSLIRFDERWPAMTLLNYHWTKPRQYDNTEQNRSLKTTNINNNNNNCIHRRNSRFVTISSLRCKLSPPRTLKWSGRNRVQITCNTSSAYHVQHVLLHATWYEGTAKLSSLTECKLHLF